MSTEREQRREQRRAATKRRVEENAAPAGSTAIRSKPVRITLDLSPSMYQRLTKHVLGIGMDTGYKVAQADVLRALILAMENPEVAEHVTRLVRKDRELRDTTQ